MHSFLNRSLAPLTRDQLQRYVPSAFALEPWQQVSKNYKFIPSINIIEAMEREGFSVVSARQSRTRIEGKEAYTKHMIRFRRAGSNLIVGDTFPEVILVNSHDRTSAYKLFAGLFRLACLNGMVASVGTMGEFTTQHKGNIEKDVIEASYRIVEEFPRLADTAKAWLGKPLSEAQQLAYADAAAMLRWEPEQERPTAREMLTVRRTADRTDAATLWGSFQRVQESLLKGGDRYVHTDEKTHRQTYKHTRTINGIDQDVKLNRALWTLTEKMAAMV